MRFYIVKMFQLSLDASCHWRQAANAHLLTVASACGCDTDKQESLVMTQHAEKQREK